MTQKIINNRNIAQINSRLEGQNSLYLIIGSRFLAENRHDVLLETVLIIGLLFSPMILNFLKRSNLSLITGLNEARRWPAASYKHHIIWILMKGLISKGFDIVKD